MTNSLTIDVDSDGVALLTVDQKDRSMNIIDRDFISELEAAIDRVLTEDAIKGAVITSAKDSFFAGADLNMIHQAASSGLPPAEMLKMAQTVSQLFRRMETGGKPVKQLAKEGTKPFAVAIPGLAMGGGLEISLACHYRVVADDPKAKLALPEVLVGLLPGWGGTQRMPRLIGIADSLLYITSGKNFSPQDALSKKLVHEVAPRAEIVDRAKAWVRANPSVKQPWDTKGFRFPGGGGAMHPGSVQTFIASSAMAQEKTQHNFPAVERILSCVYEGSIVPIDVGLKIESKYFTKCLMEPQSGNMIRTLFVNKQAAEKGVARPEGPEELKVKKLGVLGAGMMGAGIAYVSAQAGMEVVLLDREMEYAEKGKAYSVNLVEKGVSRGKVSQEAGEALLARIKPATDYAELGDVDLVVEAVFEDTSVKEAVIKQAEAAIRPGVVFATNTSTLPISGLAEFSERPKHFIGVHFFSPVDKMPLVEIILGKESGDEALAAAIDYVGQIKKTPIVVNDGRGFYANSVVMPYLSEAMGMVAEGVKPALIENAARMLGMPVGPLALVDETSIELGYRIMSEARKAEGEAYTEQPGDRVLAALYDAGRMGRKNAKGFYDYPDDGQKALWPGLSELFPLAATQPTVEAVKERLLYRQVIDAVRQMDREILRDPASGDIGAIFGWGFAPWTGGPFSYVDTVGVGEFVRVAETLASEHGERFSPSPRLKDMAEKGARFHQDAA